MSSVLRYLPRLAVLICGSAAAIGFGQAPARPTFQNVSVHDPALVRDGGTYYVFGSHLASAKSTDLMNWTQISTAPTVGNALVPNPAVEFAEALTWAQATTFWAPDVIKLPDGRFHFYYCACKGDSPRSALGIASADAITGPYKNDGILLKSGMWGQPSPDGRIYDNAIHPNTVDPSVFFDASGKYWMVYGSYSGGIFILAMDPTTGQPVAGQGYGKKLMGGNNTTIEGPFILYSPETKFYYLFVTFGGLDANGGYNIRMGRSPNPDGPYVDAEGNDLTNVRGAPGTLFDNASIAPYGVKLMGNCQFLHVTGEPGTVSNGYVSPGGTSGTYDAQTGQYLMVFHTRFVGRGEYHEVRVHQMYLNEDGWFVVAPHRFAHETLLTPATAQIPGDYKLINHGKGIAATVSTSVPITLNADGTISGSATGTWRLTGDHYATLALGGTTYRGVFAPQWDDDNQRWVQTFTAISTAGVAVWGSKVAGSTQNVPPSFGATPASQAVSAGQAVTLSIAVGGSPTPTLQWRRNGTPIAGATNASYTMTSVGTNDAGTYTLAATNPFGTATSLPMTLTLSGRPEQVVVPNGDRTTQIVNLSTRGIVATGEDVLIAGFVVAGPADKKLLILGSGLNLRKFGLTGEIGRPRLKLIRTVNGQDTTLAENADWQTAGTDVPTLISKMGAQPLTPSTDPAHGDAALAVTVQPGAYTVVVSPDAASATQDGIALVEIYDASANDGSKLVNISSRGRIESGARQMIVGVSVAGSGKARLMIRGVGPTLKALGVGRALANPSQTLYQTRSDGQAVIATNDDWWFSAQADQIAALAPTLGAFALGATAADSVVLLRVDPGLYSTIISPSDAQAGVALAEIYDANVP